MAFLGAEGVTGELRAAGRLVARLDQWTVNVEGGVWRVRAGLAEVQPVWLTAGGAYDVTLHRGRSVWRWRRVPLTVAEPTMMVLETTQQPEA